MNVEILSLDGDRLAVLDRNRGIALFTLGSSGSANLLTQQLISFRYAEAIDMANDVVAVAAGPDGTILVEVTDDSLSVMATIPSMGWATDVDFYGDTLLIADESGGLAIIDCSNLSTPVELGRLLQSRPIVGVRHYGGVAYASERYSSLLVVDLADPTQPIVTDSFAIASTALFMDGTRLVVGSTTGYHVFDASIPSEIDSVRVLETSSVPYSFGTKDGLLYIGKGSTGFEVYDFSDPQSMALILSDETAGAVSSFAFFQDFIYIADFSALLIYNSDVGTNIGDTEPGVKVPERYLLQQNYPNPFNPSTTISFSLEQSQHVHLSVINVLGQEVDVLLDKTLPAGQHRIQWRPAIHKVASGVYFYRLMTDTWRQTRKMVFLK
jgi:hypothetical protein